jgi:hypothetical protein
MNYRWEPGQDTATNWSPPYCRYSTHPLLQPCPPPHRVSLVIKVGQRTVKFREACVYEIQRMSMRLRMLLNLGPRSCFGKYAGIAFGSRHVWYTWGNPGSAFGAVGVYEEIPRFPAKESGRRGLSVYSALLLLLLLSADSGSTASTGQKGPAATAFCFCFCFCLWTPRRPPPRRPVGHKPLRPSLRQRAVVWTSGQYPFFGEISTTPRD